MKRKLSLLTVLLIAAVCGLSFFTNLSRASTVEPQTIPDQIIARERASFEAWQRKDKPFFENFLSDDATFFSPQSPYLETDPKVNFMPKFEKYAEMFKITDFQMHNPRVQVYGDTAILTYNSSVSVSMGGQPINYTAKVTSVYVKQGNSWRVVHAHESMNPSAR